LKFQIFNFKFVPVRAFRLPVAQAFLPVPTYRTSQSIIAWLPFALVPFVPPALLPSLLRTRPSRAQSRDLYLASFEISNFQFEIPFLSAHSALDFAAWILRVPHPSPSLRRVGGFSVSLSVSLSDFSFGFDPRSAKLTFQLSARQIHQLKDSACPPKLSPLS
jgi:hypothetical protein